MPLRVGQTCPDDQRSAWGGSDRALGPTQEFGIETVAVEKQIQRLEYWINRLTQEFVESTLSEA